MDDVKRVHISDELFDGLGVTRVDWGEPDADGFYTPTVTNVGIVITEAMLQEAMLAANPGFSFGKAAEQAAARLWPELVRVSALGRERQT